MAVEVSGVDQRYARPATVGMVGAEGEPASELYLAHLPDGPIMVLTGPAAALYRAVVAGAQPVAALAVALEVDADEIDAEGVEELLAEWVDGGLLVRG